MLMSIQSLRALAATFVAVFHVIMFSYDGREITWLTSGVDIFFVISGFVILASTENKTIGAGQFLFARAARIVPFYWICLAIAVLLNILKGHGFDVQEILSSFLFIFHKNSITGEPTPILVPGWSLNYEVYFYLLFAMTLTIPVRWRIALLAIWFALMVIGRRYAGSTDQAFLFRMTSPLPLEFVAGMVICQLRSSLSAVNARFGLLLMVLALVALSAHLVPQEPRFIFIGVPAALLVTGAVIAEPLFQGRWLYPIWRLGDASYSLYLGHALILLLVETIGWKGLFAGWAGALLLLVICYIVSLALYVAVERPVFTFAKRHLAR